VLSRVIHGTRISLAIGLGSVALATLVAIVIGVSSAFYGGKFDMAVQRCVDAIQAIPSLILALAVLSVLGGTFFTVLWVLALIFIAGQSRLMRSAALSLKSADFVEAAYVIGCSNIRIMIVHIAPNVVPLAITAGTQLIVSAILVEASVSFLGYGVQPPVATLGNLLARSERTFMVIAPWMFWAPSLVLSMTIFSVAMFGDALRDVLDPKLRGKT
jgi:peptide/nickel transport system permease protein